MYSLNPARSVNNKVVSFNVRKLHIKFNLKVPAVPVE